MLKSCLCHYSGAYILVKGNKIVANIAVAPALANNGNKKGIFESCTIFTDYMREINNTQVDNAKD